MQQGKTRILDQMRSYQEWFHVERVLDKTEHDAYEGQAQEDFFQGFEAPSNTPLSQTPAFSDEDAREERKELSFSKVLTNEALMPAWKEEGKEFTAAYLRDAQFVFSRV